MNKRLYNNIINDLAIVSAVLHHSFPNEIDAIADEYTNIKSGGGDIEKLTAFAEELIKLCETNEKYETCIELVKLKEQIR